MLLGLMCNSEGEKTLHKGPKVPELLPKGASHGPVAVILVLSVNSTTSATGGGMEHFGQSGAGKVLGNRSQLWASGLVVVSAPIVGTF